MRKGIICLILALASLIYLLYPSAVSVASQDMEDVVYLKNGIIIRGIIIERMPNVSIEIQTRDGSVFVYEMSSVVKITKEPRMSVSHGDRPISSIPMGKRAVLFNPLGVFQFGPILEGELGMSGNTYLTAHLRYSAFGLIYRDMVTNDPFEDEVSLGSMALGAGIKKFIESHASPDRFYFGGNAEYGWGSSSGE